MRADRIDAVAECRRGCPEELQAHLAGRGRYLPPGWWLVPAVLLAAGFWGGLISAVV